MGGPLTPGRGAALLAAPLALLLGLAFLLPLALLLWRAVENTELATALPETAALLRLWDGEGMPPAPVLDALVRELPAAEQAQTLGALSRRLNFEVPGFRALLLRTARAAPAGPALAAFDPRWGDPATWRMLRRNALPVTGLYLLRALDLTLTPGGGIAAMPADEAVFRDLFLRTLGIAAVVTGLCLLLGYPLAWWMTTLPRRRARIAMLVLLLPFWTSILVRTTAWFLLLQREGPLAQVLVALGILERAPTLIFTRFAVLLAMVHVLLPFMVLPLHAAMQRIDRGLLRAAASLGARPATVFLRVFLPLSAPGVAAGVLIVFTVAIGFYVTPALVGGAGDQMVSGFITFFVNQTVNWGMAAALSAWLLALVAASLWLLRRLAGGAVPGLRGG